MNSPGSYSMKLVWQNSLCQSAIKASASSSKAVRTVMLILCCAGDACGMEICQFNSSS